MDGKPGRVMPPAVEASKARRAESEAAFDLWLQQKLHQFYDSVAEEPLPPELLRLIEEDRGRRPR